MWSLALALLCTASLAWQAATAIGAALQPARRRFSTPRNDTTITPPVSVIVPVSDPATTLDACVESLLTLDYPRYEIILCAATSDRSALGRMSHLARHHSAVRTVIVETIPYANPKVALLTAALARAEHDIVLLTDDNVVSQPGRLRAHLACMHGSVGLVSAAHIGLPAAGFWSQVDAAFMNGGFARLHLAADFAGMTHVMGGSILLSQRQLSASGGLPQTGGTLCEDATLRARYPRTGRAAALCAEPVVKLVPERTLSEVWERHLRWFHCRSRHAPVPFALEALLSPLVAATAAAAAAPAFDLSGPLAAAVVLAMALLIELMLVRIMRWPCGPLFVPAWLMRELLVLPLWFSALGARTVRWRGRRMAFTTVDTD